jgi:hypothetical protein
VSRSGARDRVEFLQVKTLGPTRPDEGYDRTRRFYAQLGFRPLEEIRDLWPENPCLIMVKALRADAVPVQAGPGDSCRPGEE